MGVTKLSVVFAQTSVDSSGKKETLINDVYPPRYSASPQITVINHDDAVAGSSYGSHHPRLTKQGMSGTSTKGTVLLLLI